MCILEPDCSFIQIFFEVVSAFGTVGLSTGITPELCTAGKLVIISVMFIGRLGAFTLLTMWISRPESAIRYSEEALLSDKEIGKGRNKVERNQGG